MALVDRITSYPVIQDEARVLAVMEAMIPYVKKHPDSTIIGIEPHLAAKFKFDLYGLFTHLGIEQSYHYVMMRMNGYSSSQDFKSDRTSLLVPAYSLVDNLIEVALTKKE